MATFKEFIDKVKPEFDKSFRFLQAEMDKLRTSRATPSLVEDVQVNCFGSTFALNQLASISCPEPNQIVISPWDTSYIEPIEKAILQSGLGMSAMVEKNLIRLSLPLLTEEYRKNLLKILNEKAEQARQTMRHWRDDTWTKVQAAQREKKLTEDDKFHGKEGLQKLIDDYAKKIKELIGRKEKELL